MKRDGQTIERGTARVTLETGLPGIRRREIAPGVHEVTFSREAAEVLFPPVSAPEKRSTRQRWSLDGRLAFVRTASARRRHGMTAEALAEASGIPAALLLEFEDPNAVAEPDRRDQAAIVAAFNGSETMETLFPMELDDAAPGVDASAEAVERNSTRPPRTSTTTPEAMADQVERERRAELAAEAAGVRSDLDRVSLREGIDNLRRRLGGH
jgi:transcriptional regulator with XRE-family HTH domain